MILFLKVTPFMIVPVPRDGKPSFAYFAFIWLIACVFSHVCRDCGPLISRESALFTTIQSSSAVELSGGLEVDRIYVQFESLTARIGIRT